MNFLYQDDLLFPDYSLYTTWYILRHNGVDCDPIEPYLFTNQTMTEVFGKYSDFKSACFLCSYENYQNTLQAAKHIKESFPGTRTELIGEYPHSADEILKTGSFDAVVRGEWDKTLFALIKTIVKKGTSSVSYPGVSYIHKGAIHHNPDSKPMTDTEVEHLPFAEYEILPENVYTALSLETARGNPYFNVFPPSRYGKVWRYISAMGILERIVKCEKYFDRVKEPRIIISDEYFTGDDKRLHDLAQAIRKKKMDIKLHYRCRCSDLMEESLTANLTAFTGGIILDPVFGHNFGLRKIKKGYDKLIITYSARYLKKYGLAEKSIYNFVTGFPWESDNLIKQTKDFAAELEDAYGVKTNIEEYSKISAYRFGNYE